MSPRRSRAVARSAPVALTAAVGRGRRLSEGSLVQASIRARLLGIPLLRLDATVVLAPATCTSSSSAGLGKGDSLVEAVRDINDGAEILAEIRSNGT